MNPRVAYGARRATPWLIGTAAVGVTLALYIVLINKAPYWLNPALNTPPSAGVVEQLDRLAKDRDVRRWRTRPGSEQALLGVCKLVA